MKAGTEGKANVQFVLFFDDPLTVKFNIIIQFRIRLNATFYLLNFLSFINISKNIFVQISISNSLK